MAEVFFQSGVAKKRKGIGESVESLGEALKEKANCGICGCDPVLGLMTQIDALNGDLMGMYIYNGELVIEAYDTAVANLKTYCAAR